MTSLRLLIGRALLWFIEPARVDVRQQAEWRAQVEARRARNFAAWCRGERPHLFDLDPLHPDDTRSAG